MVTLDSFSFKFTLENGAVVDVTVKCQPEDLEIEGNASASDPESDAATNDWIRKQLDAGNPWAWCHIEVEVHIETDDSLVGIAGLGGCSYHGAEDFKTNGGYLVDMVLEAVTDLKRRATALADQSAVVLKVLP